MRAVGFIVLVCQALLGQDSLRFEAASVKLRPADSPIEMIGGAPSGSRLTLEAMSLSDLVSWSYNVKPWQVAGGPAWASMPKDRTMLDGGTRRFDINAKAEGEAEHSLDDFRGMMRSLLAERFHLTVHREMRDTPAYFLVVDKSGPKFKESAPDARGILRMNGGGKITASGGTMDQLTGWFSNANGVDRPVLNRTGLAGHYDFTLQWSIPRVDGETDPSAPSIFTAMTEQLGLKLDPQKAPVEYVVIDSAEMPGEN
jgi:uncharacterized protein (TIGR03435 family)